MSDWRLLKAQGLLGDKKEIHTIARKGLKQDAPASTNVLKYVLKHKLG
ncbi:hypothetical protein [Paenibacillus terrae]|nr:hypothetical protein [Paenibacillus terrae]